MDLKERIQELCRQNNISMNKAETDLGFGKGYISKLGKSTPNATKIHKLADYFMSKGGPVPEDLLDLIKEENEDERVKKALILVIEIHNASVKK